MKQRQQSSTSYPITFLMVDSADHITGKTGLSPTVTISKNGAGFGAPSGAVSEIGNGWYALAGNATDRNALGDLLIHATAAGADPVDDRYCIVPWNPFDAASLGLTNLDAAISSRLAPATAGRTLEVAATGEASANVTLWKGDAPADLSVNGRVDATVGEMQSDVIMASAYDESTAWPLTDTEKLSLERLQSMIESVPFGELSYYRFRDSALDTVIGADGDTLETLSDQIDGVGVATGSGAISFPVTVNDEDSNPIDGVEVWISTDSAGASVVAGTLSTDALGLATFMLDAGTYYLWRQKSGYNFTNPVTIVVS